jgi:hypothetical protein
MEKIEIIKTFFINFNYLKDQFVNSLMTLNNERLLVNEIKKKQYLVSDTKPNPELFDKYKKIIK